MIPKSVVVSRKRYDVHVGDAKRFKRANGYIDFVPANIYVHTNKRSKMQETFWHELTHAILYEMDHPLYNNEKFVTRFSKLLNQAINTAKL
jgi:predicted SprT family Zn-dependent metalloprotease